MDKAFFEESAVLIVKPFHTKAKFIVNVNCIRRPFFFELLFDLYLVAVIPKVPGYLPHLFNDGCQPTLA